MNSSVEKIRILMLEDVPSDAELIESELRDAGLSFTTLRVETREAFEQALRDYNPDIVLSDYRLPAYNGCDALDYVCHTYPHIPVIIVTGALGDEEAVELLKQGACDYILKEHLARLASAITRALSEEYDARNRKLAEEELRKSRDLLQSVVETAPVRIFWKDRDSHYLGCNTPFAIDAGLSKPEELIGKNDFDMGWKDQAELYRADDKVTMESGIPKLNYEEPQTKPDGNIYWLRTSKVPLRDENNRVIGILGIYQDITDYKKAEEALKSKEKHYRLLFESMLNGFAYCKMIYEDDKPVDFIYLEINENFEKLTGLKDVINKKVSEVIPGIQRSNPELFEIYGRVAVTGNSEKFETYIPSIDIWFSISVYSPEKGYFIAVFEIITERKKVEEALRDSEERARSITQTLLDALIVMDDEGKIEYWNPAAQRIFGYSEPEVLGKNVHEVLAPERYHGAFEAAMPEFLRTGTGAIVGRVRELEALHKDGHEFPIELAVSAFKRKNKWYAIGVVRDITQRKKAESEILKLNRIYRMLSDCNQSLIREREESLLLHDICDIIVNDGGYKLAWVGYPLDDEYKSMKPAASAGEDSDYLEKASISWADTERGRGPVGIAMRTGKVTIIEDMQTDPRFVPWREEAAKRGYGSCIGLPLINSGEILGVLTIYGAVPQAFSEMEITLLEELAADLAFGIYSTRLHKEKERVDAEINRLNRIYKTLSKCNESLVRSQNEQQLLRNICDLIINEGGYRMAWVGYKQDDEEKTVKPVAHAGYEEGYLKNIRISWEDNEYGREPTGVAIRTGSTSVNSDTATNPVMIPWRDEALKRVYNSSLALPLIGNGKILGSLTIYSLEPDVFHEEEMKLLQELAFDLAFGIASLRVRTERQQAEESLSESEKRYKHLSEELEIKVKERTAQLEASNKELEAFTYSVSHDLRAPLRNIDSFNAAVMEDYGDKLGETGKDYIQRAHNAIDRMNTLIDDLLSLSRITRGEVNKMGVNLSDIASAVIKPLRESEPARIVEVIIAENMLGDADPHLMEIALTNLLNNAWKYTSKKDKARIEFGRTEKDGKTVYYVRDNGAGFDMNYYSKLFQPFQRLHTTDEFPGTGIGLATVYRILKKHGGDIWAEGKVNEGATFYFILSQ